MLGLARQSRAVQHHPSFCEVLKSFPIHDYVQCLGFKKISSHLHGNRTRKGSWIYAPIGTQASEESDCMLRHPHVPKGHI